MEEIVTIDNQQYKLTSDRELTYEQRLEAINDIRRQIESQIITNPRTNQVASLSATCPTAPNNKKYVGQTVGQAPSQLECTPQGGNGVFTVVFTKDTTTTLPTSGPISGKYTSSYTFQQTDVSANPHTFKVSVTDTCTGNPAGEESCQMYCVALNISVNVGGLTSIYLASGANSPAITKTCSDTITTSITCPTLTYISDNPTYITVSPTGVINMSPSAPTGTTGHVWARATGYGGPVVDSNQILVTLCGPIVPNLTVS